MKRKFQKLAMDLVEDVYDDGTMDATAEQRAKQRAEQRAKQRAEQRAKLSAKLREPEVKKQILNLIYELRECPVCLQNMCAPIYQCRNGHTLCSMCYSKVEDRCPICRMDMGSLRCLAMEKVIKPLEDPYNCLVDEFKCGFTGNIPEIIAHLTSDVHEAIMHDGSEISVKPFSEKMNTDSGTLKVYNCFGCYFCLHLYSCGSEGYVACVRFIGEENEAKRFSYSFKIGRDGQKRTYKSVPKSIRVRDENFLNDGMFISPFLWEEIEQLTLEQLTLEGQISEN